MLGVAKDAKNVLKNMIVITIIMVLTFMHIGEMKITTGSWEDVYWRIKFGLGKENRFERKAHRGMESTVSDGFEAKIIGGR